MSTSTLLPAHQLYANLMDEARMRLHAMRDAIDAREKWVPRHLQEFCYLQLRMLTEQIAVGCLIAHGDVTNQRTLGNWNVPEVIKKLKELNSDFYPKGIRIRTEGDGVRVDEYSAEQLSKEDLVKLWQTSGDYLHRGTAKSVFNEDPNGQNVNIEEILRWGAKILNLLEQHVISSADKRYHLIVALLAEETGSSVIWLAESPPTQA